MITVALCVARGAMTIGFAMAETASEDRLLNVRCCSLCATLIGLAEHCLLTRAAPRVTLSAQDLKMHTERGMKRRREDAMHCRQ